MRERYPLPEPSPDTSPLTLEELATAACTGPNRDICFPEDAGTLEAKMLCHGCPIQARCLAVSIRNEEPHGIWGGATTQERGRIRARLLRREDAT